MKKFEKEIASYLLQSKAIKLEPTNPFTWASGWKSPIYCDNRKTLSFPEIRTKIKEAFVEVIKVNFPDCQTIAGVATGAIAQGALIADEMKSPFIYIRSKAKGHGMENLIEGSFNAGDKVVVVEDLVSTGKSSLNAVDALHEAGAEVLGMVAIFTYGFPVAEENFEKSGCKLITLSNYNALLELGLESKTIEEDKIGLLQEWRKSPDTWGK
jgi:orotate phosphoribosyltransferase